MAQIAKSSPSLQQDEKGIWHAGKDISTISYPDEGNEACFQNEDNSFWFQNRNTIIRMALDRFPFKAGFVDIGGGNGYQVRELSATYPEKDFYLVEPGYKGCVNARSRGVQNVYNMLSNDFPFSHFAIDAVGFFDVIEHIENDAELLASVQAAVEPGTLFFITVPAFQTLWSDVDEISGHYRRYTKSTLRNLAASAGLQVLECSYFFSYLVAPMYLLRSLPHRFGRERNTQEIMASEATHHSGSKLDPVFKALGTVENKVMPYCPMPFGTSLLAILKK